MAGRGRPKKDKAMITPIDKRRLNMTPDKVPESASLDDYERMMTRMAANSNSIIDNALDSIEGKAPSKPTTEPEVETDSVEVEIPDESTGKEPVQESKSEQAPAVEQPAGQTEDSINPVSIRKDLSDALSELDRLQKELSFAKKQLDEYQSGRLKSAFQTEIDKLVNDNDDLILKNSELEFEISRLRAENGRIKQELEILRNEKRLPPQTYSKEAYTRPPVRQNNTRPSAKRPMTQIERQIELQRQMMMPPRRGMNGYESWN